MSDEPRIVARAAERYVAVTERVAPDQHGDAIDHGFAEVFGWLAVHEGVSAAGAPLIRYIEVDMADSLLIDLAVPVEGTPPPDERVRAGVLPADDYVTLLFRGHYDGLVAANAAVQQWGEQHGVRWAMDSPIAWRARIEQYLTDPREEPDPAQWETEIAYLIEVQPVRS
jgi:effector-binding domain-containing protein